MIITEIEIRKLIDGLAKSGKNFYNEKQFQFELAWTLRTYFNSIRKNYEIHLEYRSEKNNHYYDIVIAGNNEFCPIELKHKLLNHFAQDLGRYDFIKDIERIENWGKDNPNRHIDCGYVILLTDDHLYWEKCGKGCHYQNFSLKDSMFIISGKKNWFWNPPLSTSAMKKKYGGRARGIKTRQYAIKWTNYFNGAMYLLLKI